jgi:hypothetical protein
MILRHLLRGKRSGAALRSAPAWHAGAERTRAAPDVRSLTVIASLFLATLIPLASAQTLPATQPAIDPELAKVHFPWFVLHYTAQGYRVHVTVNGTEYANFDDAKGSDTRATPLREGKNEIVVDLTHTAAVNAKDDTLGSIYLQAAPRQKPKDDDAVVDLADLDVEEGFGQLKLTVDFVNSQPRNFTAVEQVWSDAEHKKLVSQHTTDGDCLADEFAHEKEQSWRPDGKLAKESSLEQGKLVSATAYKPDGTVAAEVIAGQGVDATYDNDGHCESTVTVKDGRQHGEQTNYHSNGKPAEVFNWKEGAMDGPFKRYDETGKLRVTGQMKDNGPEGVWHKLDDDGKPVADCEYKDGLLVKGENLYTPEQKE